MEAMRRATVAIIVVDDRGTVMLVCVMVCMAGCNDVHNCVRGCIRECDTCWRNGETALAYVVKRARAFHAKRNAPLVVCNGAYAKCRGAVVSAVVYGGLTDQKVVFEASPGAVGRRNSQQPFFPNFVDVTWGRAHRWRGLCKGMRRNLRKDLPSLIGGSCNRQGLDRALNPDTSEVPAHLPGPQPKLPCYRACA